MARQSQPPQCACWNRQKLNAHRILPAGAAMGVHGQLRGLRPRVARLARRSWLRRTQSLADRCPGSAVDAALGGGVGVQVRLRPGSLGAWNAARSPRSPVSIRRPIRGCGQCMCLGRRLRVGADSYRLPCRW